MKNILYVLLCSALVACGSASSSDKTEESDKTKVDSVATTSTTNKKSGSNEVNDLQALMSDFPKKWKLITNENEEFVFYKPCDAAIQQIQFVQQADKSYKLQYLTGQEAIEYNLVSMKRWEEPFADEVEVYYEITFKEGEEMQSAKINFSKPELAGWGGFFGEPGPKLFAPENSFNKYPTLTSPCFECFGEDECRTKQDWGIGVVQPKFEETIYFYNFKGDENPAKEISFSNGMVANYDELRAWGSFESYFPDYDIFYIRCLAEEGEWYKVVGNKKLNRVMWMKKSPKLKFLPWKEYLKATLDVAILDPKANPFRVGKGSGEIITSSCTGGYEVLDMEGMYIKVKQNELTTACEDGEPLATEGWIQWRDEYQQLISIAWVM